MGPLSTNDTKLFKAKAFCNKRLTDLRSEERRRVNLILTIIFYYIHASISQQFGRLIAYHYDSRILRVQREMYEIDDCGYRTHCK